MSTVASQITSLTIVYTTVYSDPDQSKHQSSASLAFVWGIHRDRWIPRTKVQLRGKCFHLMTSSWFVLRLVLRGERPVQSLYNYKKETYSRTIQNIYVVCPQNYAHSSRFVVVCCGLVQIDLTPLLYGHRSKLVIVPGLVKQPWRIQVNRSHHCIINS